MTATSAGEFRSIPIEQLHESALNPRRHFHEASLQELAASISEHGILTPLLARPSARGPMLYELAAGHRRLRAALRTQVVELPVLVREMTDTQFIEVLTIENLQRDDVHALEEAQGFADLIKHAGYDVARIAERVGRSVRYVYDRLKLLQLTPALQDIFFKDEITAGHAVLLARLSPDDQARALEATDALFTIDHGDRSLRTTYAERAAELELDDLRKPMSVRELQSWIDQHVRFDVAADDVPQLFPETAVIVTPAIEQAEKIISITHNYHVDPGAKPEDGERTYGPMSWKRADGQHDSKPCDRSVTGVIVVGPGRGEAFKVCVDKKKCKTHWASEQRASAQRAKQSATGSTSTADDTRAKEIARQEQQRKDQQTARNAFASARTRILEAVAAQVKKLPVSATGALADLLVQEINGRRSGSMPKSVTRGKTAVDLIRFLAFSILESETKYYNAHETFPEQAKALGVDVATIIKGTPAALLKVRMDRAAKKSPAKKRVKAKKPAPATRASRNSSKS